MTTNSRADEIARRLPDEVQRQHLVDMLEHRWTKTLTLVTAPGGYGKTRALAQAVRDNEEDPLGIDIYVRVRPAFADPDRLISEILNSIGQPSDALPDSASVLRIVDALTTFAPSAVSLILDDVQHLMASAEATAVLANLLNELPRNAHLVLTGRQLPELATVRLQADDQVLEIGEDELIFTPAEIESLAAQHESDSDIADQLAGWPALVRLALISGKSGSEEFLMQEILDGLAPETVRGLAVTALAGRADQELLSRCEVGLSPERLAHLVPMLEVVPDGSAQAHDLWKSIAHLLAEPAQQGPILDTIVDWHSESQRHDEAISTALAGERHDAAKRSLMQALNGADTDLTATLTARWLDMFATTSVLDADDAEVSLLRGWNGRLTHGSGYGDEDIKAARQAFRARGDVMGEARAGIEYAFRGFLAGDPTPVLETVERSPELIRGGATYLSHLGSMTSAVIAELSGDFALAIEHAQRSVGPGLPREFAELALRHRATLWFLVGDGERAVETMQELVDFSPSSRNLLLQKLANFGNGDIDELVAEWYEIRYLEFGNRSEDFSHAVLSVFVDAALGLTPDLRLVRSAVWDRSREQLHLALCEWSADLIAGNEERANETLRGEIAKLGIDDPYVSGDFRRFLVSGYVVDESIRETFEDPTLDPPLGEYHVKRRGLARILVSMRAGTPVDWSGYLTPQETICSMSLPWSVEIACGLVLHDEAKGVELADSLVEATGIRAQHWFRRLADSESHAAAGARQLLSMLPPQPSEQTSIVCFGPLALQRPSGGIAVTRQRVRQLLGLLILRESIDRDAAMSMLWPDMDSERARNNLRITLTHLRSDLEPDRMKGEPPFHLIQRGNQILLRRSDFLSCDVWDCRDSIVAWRALSKVGERARAVAAVEGIVASAGGRLLPDLDDLAQVAPDVADLQAQLRDATVDVAEFYLASGRAEQAEALGQKLLAADGYDERAHAVVIAACLDRELQGTAEQAIDRCLAALKDVGAPPAAATRMLLRRAGYPSEFTRRTA